MNKKVLKKILKDHLVDPILRLKETHPDHYFTEKGYETLLDNAIDEICLYIGEIK